MYIYTGGIRYSSRVAAVSLLRYVNSPITFSLHCIPQSKGTFLSKEVAINIQYPRASTTPPVFDFSVYRARGREGINRGRAVIHGSSSS